MAKHDKLRVQAEDERDVDEHRRLKAPVVYEIIRQEGVEELDRPLRSLWWSGFAAGLAISTSVYAEAFLHALLPDTEHEAQNTTTIKAHFVLMQNFAILIP